MPQIDTVTPEELFPETGNKPKMAIVLFDITLAKSHWANIIKKEMHACIQIQDGFPSRSIYTDPSALGMTRNHVGKEKLRYSHFDWYTVCQLEKKMYIPTSFFFFRTYVHVFFLPLKV